MIEDGDKSTSVKRLIFKRASNFLPAAIKTPFDSSSSSGPSAQDDQPAKPVGLTYHYSLPLSCTAKYARGVTFPRDCNR
jgi:hypothetical protein